MKEQQDNSGILFKNTRKETDRHPDRTGSARIGGTDYWVSAWIKTDKNGEPFLSLAFKLKDSPKVQTQGKPASRRSQDDDSDIPF